VRQHDVGQLADLGRGRALHLHRHTERRDLGRGGDSGHDLFHRPGRLTPGKIRAGGQPTQYLPPLRDLRYRLRFTTRLDHAPIVACGLHAAETARERRTRPDGRRQFT